MTSHFVDTGPLVALLNPRDTHHGWVRSVLAELPTPVGTCEAVIAEACYLLRRIHGGSAAVLEMVSRGALSVDFALESEIEPVAALMTKYADAPMSLADACLVRMTELERDSVVVTTDRDFTRYRRNRRQTIPVAIP